jgi:cell division protein FtsW (lipid II flippase)
MKSSHPFRLLLPTRLSASLLRLAALFLGAYSLGLTISPAVRARAIEGLAELRWVHWLGFAVWLAVFFLMDRQVRIYLPNRDVFLIPLTAMLSGWGLLTILRLTTLFGLRQTLWLAVCGVLFILALRFREQILPTLRRYKYVWLFSGFAITALTFFFGTNPSDIEPHLWLGCCGVYFQPSEILKLLLVIYLAAYLADRQPLVTGWLALLAPTAMMAGLALLLLLVQRDLGTAWVFIFIYMILIYNAAGRRRFLVASVFILVVALVAGYELVGLVHQRVDIWFNPWSDPSGSGYQIVQSLMAQASGGMLGRGPGMGSPGIVPVSHSDFIYTSIVEETGLVGAVALLATISFLCLRALRIALRARDAYQRYLAVGLSAYLAGQSLLIIGGNIRMLPLTGVTLPYVSYGGSSLLASFCALLLLLLVSHEGVKRAAPVTRSRPTLVIAGIVLGGFGLAALVTGWWTVVRGPDLLTRADNARRSISDRFVWRGALLDRSGITLNQTNGQVGDYERQYLLPELGNVLGYSHPNLAQSGLEAGLDGILRGEEGQATFMLWMNHLQYGQPPPGLDVRLSLDAQLSGLATQLLAGQSGAAVVMDATNGEVLAMASQPGFNPSTLDEDWERLSAAGDSPLVNRAAQLTYPPGTALGPFLLAATRAAGLSADLPADTGIILDGRRLDCISSPGNGEDWNLLVASACPGALAQLGVALGGERLLALLADLGFYSAPPGPLDLQAQRSPLTLDRPEVSAIGQDGLRVSPLQMARAACAFSDAGRMLPAKMVLEIEDPAGGWLPVDQVGEATLILDGAFSVGVVQGLTFNPLSIWEVTGRAVDAEGQTFTWYLAGSLSERSGEARCAVVLLESDNASLARSIGRQLLSATPSD